MSSRFFIPASPGHFPDADGYFGAFGGKFIPQALVAAVDEVTGEHAASLPAGEGAEK
jgi:tryptophan synthase beta chain